MKNLILKWLAPEIARLESQVVALQRLVHESDNIAANLQREVSSLRGQFVATTRTVERDIERTRSYEYALNEAAKRADSTRKQLEARLEDLNNEAFLDKVVARIRSKQI